MLYLVVLSSLVAFAFGQTTYCSCGPTTTVDSNLGEVKLDGDSQSISDVSNCPGFIGPKDLTALKADLSPGGSYKLTFFVTTCGNSFPTLSGAWIDYNKNFVFDDAEKLGAFSTQKNQVDQTFSVPAIGDALVTGETRLRVQVQETQATTLSPCASFPYGATKDFTIVLKAGGSGSSSGGMSGGVVFILIVLIGGVVYAAAGCGYNKFAKGTTGPRESCPQGDFWFNLPANVIEGFRFTKRKLCGGGDYDKLGGGPAIDQNDL